MASTYNHSSKELGTSIVASRHLLVETTDSFRGNCIVMKLDGCWYNMVVMRSDGIVVSLLGRLLILGGRHGWKYGVSGLNLFLQVWV